jgi:molecular chaperone DnaJ
MKRDHYEVLGVGRDASADELKSAYRRLAIQHHPDKTAGDEGATEKFKEASEAYSVLSDPEKRARYDRYGHDAARGSGSGFGFDPSAFTDFSDLFGQFFGGFARSERPSGGDLMCRLELSFRDAAFGVEAPVEIQRLERCDSCGGSGAEKGSRPVRCGTCGGRGQVRFAQGFFAVARTCPACRGDGTRIEKPCPDCRGEGRVRRDRTVTIRVPGGVETGSRLRLSGEGNAARPGGVPGDLYVVLTVSDHDVFTREGDDVVVDLDLPFPVFALGGEVTVPTLDGEDRLEIAPGTRSGTEIRLRRKGVQKLGSSGRGDQVVRLTVAVPRELAAQEREMLEAYASLIHAPISRKRTFARVKKLFEG